jgi:hypothetical protein
MVSYCTSPVAETPTGSFLGHLEHSGPGYQNVVVGHLVVVVVEGPSEVGDLIERL